MSVFFPADDNDLALGVTKKGKLGLRLEKDPVVSGAIKLRHRFQFFEAEWFLDKRLGIPYFRIVFVKNPDFAVIRTLFRKVVLSVPVIATCDELAFGYDNATRAMFFAFAAFASDGRKVEGGSGKPFLIDGRDLANYQSGEEEQ